MEGFGVNVSGTDSTRVPRERERGEYSRELKKEVEKREMGALCTIRNVSFSLCLVAHGRSSGVGERLLRIDVRCPTLFTGEEHKYGGIILSDLGGVSRARPLDQASLIYRRVACEHGCRYFYLNLIHSLGCALCFSSAYADSTPE